jgi:hypothetical protein
VPRAFPIMTKIDTKNKSVEERLDIIEKTLNELIDRYNFPHHYE